MTRRAKLERECAIRLTRRDWLEGAFGLALVLSVGCEGTSNAEAGGADAGSPDAGTGGATTVPPKDGGVDHAETPVGPVLSTLTLHPSEEDPWTGDETVDWMGTFYPAESAVPSGSVLVSEDDPSLRCSVLSTWPDGSARVCVVAGRTSVTSGTPKEIALASGAPQGTALTAERIGQLIARVDASFGATIGAASITDFSSPVRVWWANERVICARYHLTFPATAPGLIVLVDVHAFAEPSTRVLVEVTVINGVTDHTVSGTPKKPALVAYTEATFSVTPSNGASTPLDGTPVSAPAAGEAYFAGFSGGSWKSSGHEAYRGFYVKKWLGGEPRVVVTHDPAYLQSLPFFLKMARGVAGVDEYRTDYESNERAQPYVPWNCGLLNVPYMGSASETGNIGPLTSWDARYVQSGSKWCAKVSVAQSLFTLSCGIHYRNPSGEVSSFADVGARRQGVDWPSNESEPRWEIAHSPCIGIIPFLCQPSPILIETAQAHALWMLTRLSKDHVLSEHAQVRGRAWGYRSLAHATFLTPDDHPWKAPAESTLDKNVQFFLGWKASPYNKLDYFWNRRPDKFDDHIQTAVAIQGNFYLHEYMTCAAHAADKMKVCPDQASASEFADWVAKLPVRWINEAVGGSWREQSWATTIGRGSVTPGAPGVEVQGSGVYSCTDMTQLDQPSTWGEMVTWYWLDSPPPSGGTWFSKGLDGVPIPENRYYNGAGTAKSVANPKSTYSWPHYARSFWAALVVAVDRGIPGAEAAWAKATHPTDGVTDLTDWLDAHRHDARWVNWPRDKAIDR